MGKFKVRRLVWRAAGWARGGSDDRFCRRDDEREIGCLSEPSSVEVVVEVEGAGRGKGWDASGRGPWMASPVPGELSISMLDQPAGRRKQVSESERVWVECRKVRNKKRREKKVKD